MICPYCDMCSLTTITITIILMSIAVKEIIKRIGEL